jgi:hypothetical protein
MDSRLLKGSQSLWFASQTPRGNNSDPFESLAATVLLEARRASGGSAWNHVNSIVAIGVDQSLGVSNGVAIRKPLSSHWESRCIKDQPTALVADMP